MFCSKCGAENPEGAEFCSKCGAALGASAKSAEGGNNPGERSSTGMSANVAGLLCYVAHWITGIVFVLIEKKSKFVKFHAWQSIMTFGVLFVAWLILSALIGAIGVMTFSPGLIIFAGVMHVILWVIMIGLWIALMILAYMGKMWKVPLAGNWAEKRANKTS
ncbi:MAG: zinc-ribbon domain-containing protein [Dehalococcoidia bacterium]|nr:zinc-ribbon domain-containing protein [Dehalococcoidia bacterium]